MKNLILLGSTGSIGLSALEVVREHPHDFRVVALAAQSSDEKLLAQITEFRPEAVCLTDEAAAARLAKNTPAGTRVLQGADGLRQIAAWRGGDLVVAASSGMSCLVPVLDAIAAGKNIAIANKEILVIAGRVMTEAARKHGIELLPVDSEHNAIFQCLAGAHPDEVRRIILTGSGGPLKDVPASGFRGISKDIVTRHPRWSMGPKITVDSATMMNKGLEMIEAQWLFGVGPERISIMIHPEAVVHSMVEFVDGSIIAQMGPTDMKSPLLHCMGYPKRLTVVRPGVDLTALGKLHFCEPERAKFPCLALAFEAAQNCDSTLPCVLSAADEVAVDAFLNDKIDFADIPSVIGQVMKRHRTLRAPGLDAILDADAWARTEAAALCGGPGAVASKRF